MALLQGQVTVTTVAGALNGPNALSGGVSQTAGLSLTIQVPTGGQTLFIGTSAVTSSTFAYAIPAGGSLTINTSNSGEVVFGIVAGTTQSVNLLAITNVGIPRL